MRISLLGATGRTGKWVLQSALEKGYDVNCLARNSSRISSTPSLRIFEGNPTNSTDLEVAIKDCNAIISVLNISRKSDFPWSGLITPERFLSDSMETIIPICESNGIKRIIVCTAWGVAESEDEIPGWFKWFIKNSNIGVAYQDHERQEKLLEDSNLDWTIIRPVGLSNSQSEEKIRETSENQPKPSLFISRKSVGSFMVDCLERNDLIHKKVVVSKD